MVCSTLELINDNLLVEALWLLEASIEEGHKF